MLNICMTKHRIYISVCGEGLGHSSRAIAITQELIKKDCDYLKSQKLCKVVKIPKELVM